MTQRPLRLILDVDTGIDDALALAVALRLPGVTLEAVLTVAGNVGLDLTTQNTLRVLDWLGARDIPVHAGADGPLSGALREASHWHGEDGLGGASLPASSRTAPADGVDYLIDLLLRQPGDLTLVCTGPLTNLALAVQHEPRIATAVREVVLMGGAARLPGNVTAAAEFNIYADPEAAAIVFTQPWPLVMVGLDITNQVLLTRSDREQIVSGTSPEAVLVREVTRHSFERLAVDAIALHDPLAVLVAVDPTLVSCLELPVAVETEGEHTLGMTVVDLRRRTTAAPNARVALEVDAARARELFDRALGLQTP